MNQPFLPVTINFIHGKTYRWTPANWTTSVPMFDRSIDISKLRQFLGEEVLKRTQADHQLRETLSARGYYVSITALVEIPGCRWGPMSLAEVAEKFGLASDLLDDPEGRFQRFTLNITLQLEKRQSTGDRSLVHFPHEEPQHVYHRLGRVQIPEQHYGNDIQGPLVTASGKELRKSAEITYIWALLAWREGPQGHWQLKRVRAYDFDLYCIGDADETSKWNSVPFNCAYDYSISFERVSQDGESFQQLQRRLEDRIKDGWPEPGSGVPFLPKYCFKNYQPSPHSVAEWPKHGIKVAVRCVNWLAHEGQLTDIRFPPDLQLVIEEQDTIEDIRDIINQEIDCKRTEHGVKINSATLFKPPLAKTWELELWVLPQHPENPDGQGKLHRYASGRLLAFLSTSSGMRKNDKRLYMEAHIVSKRGK
ncbi:hypothetical protein NU219Hw_g7021t1 [Hortaea werneckii]